MSLGERIAGGRLEVDGGAVGGVEDEGGRQELDGGQTQAGGDDHHQDPQRPSPGRASLDGEEHGGVHAEDQQRHEEHLGMPGDEDEGERTTCAQQPQGGEPLAEQFVAEQGPGDPRHPGDHVLVADMAEHEARQPEHQAGHGSAGPVPGQEQGQGVGPGAGDHEAHHDRHVVGEHRGQEQEHQVGRVEHPRLAQRQ